MKFFKQSEFACKCGKCGSDGSEMDSGLMMALDMIRADFGHALVINRGYTCAAHNAAIGGAAGSAHLTGHAVDIHDPGHVLRDFVAPCLAHYELWMESPRATPTWCHLQSRPAKQRIFNP